MIIVVVYGAYFFKSARKLPKKEQEKLAKLLEMLQKNPFHTQLHAKPLTGKLAGLYSFRITREWRVIFQFLTPDKIQLLYVGYRKEIYK